MISAIAVEIENGDVLLEGIGTFLPTAAYLIAQLTHAPDAVRLCPVGNVFVDEGHPLSLADYQFETLQRGLFRFSYWDVNGSYLPNYLPGRKGKWKEFLRPAQVDATGRTNNVVIGSYEKPRVRLPGAAGLPDGIPVETAVYMYVPRHDRDTFVGKLDFVSSPGISEGAHPHCIISNLAVMRFARDGALEVESLMPGVSAEEVCDRTSFGLRFREPLLPPRPLGEVPLSVLRQVVDPDGLRELEFLVGEDRLARIETLARGEAAHDRLYRHLGALVGKTRPPKT